MAQLRVLAAHRWLPILAIAALSLVASSNALGNQFTYDDVGIIAQNPMVQGLDRPAAIFSQSYWPRPFRPALYRPLTTLALALQWRLGDGGPWLFHAVSVAEYLLVCLAFLALARAVLPPPGAWIAAALFAVDPLHVEATAIGVNQAELMTALWCLLAVILYLRWRSQGDLTLAHGTALVALYLLACFTKEHGLALPGLLAAAELTVVDDPRPWQARLRPLRPLGLVFILIAVGFLAIRSRVLGDVAGTFTAEAFRGATMGGRTLTMLGVVREWLRLLLWPVYLQTDYAPREIEGAIGWGSDQTLGAVLLLAVGWIAWWSRRRDPTVTFGVLWVGVALFPVSNVLVPTGIVLAERSLFLASGGAMLAVGAAMARAGERLQDLRTLRPGVYGALALLVGAGAAASFRRERVWRDSQTLFTRMVQEAPLSYKAHWMYGNLLFRAGQRGLAEPQYRLAIALYPYSWPLYNDLGDRYREAGFCEPAVNLYYRALLVEAGAVPPRLALIACQLYLGDYAAAKRQIRIGRLGGSGLQDLERFDRTADSALAAGAPPRTVRVGETDSGHPITGN